MNELRANLGELRGGQHADLDRRLRTGGERLAQEIPGVQAIRAALLPLDDQHAWRLIDGHREVIPVVVREIVALDAGNALRPATGHRRGLELEWDFD